MAASGVSVVGVLAHSPFLFSFLVLVFLFWRLEFGERDFLECFLGRGEFSFLLVWVLAVGVEVLDLVDGVEVLVEVLLVMVLWAVVLLVVVL